MCTGTLLYCEQTVRAPRKAPPLLRLEVLWETFAGAHRARVHGRALAHGLTRRPRSTSTRATSTSQVHSGVITCVIARTDTQLRRLAVELERGRHVRS